MSVRSHFGVAIETTYKVRKGASSVSVSRLFYLYLSDNICKSSIELLGNKLKKP